MSSIEPEPAAPAPGEPAADAAAEPWGGVTQDQWEALQQQNQEMLNAVQYLSQLEQQRAQVYQPQPAQNGSVPLPDPWERPDTYQEDLQRWGQSLVAPVQQFTEEAKLSEAEERAMDILADLATREGDFDQKLARIRADQHLPAMQQRYGPGPKAAEEALAAAAAEQRAYEQQLLQRGGDQRVNQLATLSGAPGEPGSTYAQGSQQRVMPDYREGGTVTQRFFGPNRET